MSELTTPVLGSDASSFMFWLCSSGPAPGLGGVGGGSASADPAPARPSATTDRSKARRVSLLMDPLSASYGDTLASPPMPRFKPGGAVARATRTRSRAHGIEPDGS